MDGRSEGRLAAHGMGWKVAGEGRGEERIFFFLLLLSLTLFR